jgi:hypothetical protein
MRDAAGQRRARAHLVSLAFGLASTLLIPAAASAQTTDAACAQAFETGQELAQAGRLVESRRRLLTCAAPACPDFIRTPCVGALDKTEADLPSLVVVARDGGGQDVARARVKIDGVVVAERLDGAAVAVDPGEHEVAVETSGASIRRRVVVRRGERNRRVEIVLSGGAGPPPVSGAATASPSAVPAIVAFGVGGAGFTVAAVTGALSLMEQGKLDEVCPTRKTCPRERQGQIDRAKAEATASTVAGAVGVAGVGVGVALLILRRRPAKPDTRALRVVPVVSPGSFVLSFAMGP